MLDLIYEKLTEDTALTAIVDNRVFSYIIQEQTDTPAVMFEMLGATPLNTMDGTSKAYTYSISVTCVSKRVGEASVLMNIVKGTLDNIEGEHTVSSTSNEYSVADSRMTGMNLGAVMNGRLFIAEVDFDIDIISP